MTLQSTAIASPTTKTAGWEWAGLGIATALALAFGFSNLGAPSLWHDELVHVFVAKNIGDTGLPLHLSGRVFTSGTLFNYLLAGVVAVFGHGEFAVRMPSVLFAALNVALTYFTVRPLLGRPAALVAAFALAVNPWSVGWARQARFYMLQQSAYLAMLYAVWRAGEAQQTKSFVRWGIAALSGYAAGLLCGPHSVLFLGPVGVYAALRWLEHRSLKSRWTVLIFAVGVIGGLTAVGYALSLPKAEYDAIFKEGQLLDEPANTVRDHDQSDMLYYFRFFTNNLSTGYFIVACIGVVLMTIKEGRRGLFAALAIVVPILVLNYLIGYRRHRFLFFAYPFYVVAYSYALVQAAAFLRSARKSWPRMLVAALILVFGARLAVSTVRLLEDSFEAAAGSDVTLAASHPQWRKPCLYVRDHRDDAVVLCTTYLAAKYYVGHVDDWYPSRVVVWEFIESGLDGLKTLDDLKAYVAAHPRGYFIAEYWRFWHWYFYEEDVAWVEANMTRIDEACSDDVKVFAWGL